MSTISYTVCLICDVKGFATIEFTASALIDQALHSATLPSSVSTASDEETKSSITESGSRVLTDVNAFEKELMAELGIPEGLALRHRPAHFLRKNHLHFLYSIDLVYFMISYRL